MIFFIRLSRLVSKRLCKNKNLPSLQFLFICRHLETKRLSRIKKINTHYQCSFPTRCQVPPVLKSTFKFRILTPTNTGTKAIMPLHCVVCSFISCLTCFSIKSTLNTINTIFLNIFKKLLSIFLPNLRRALEAEKELEKNLKHYIIESVTKISKFSCSLGAH